jgi:hypothetical protein
MPSAAFVPMLLSMLVLLGGTSVSIAAPTTLIRDDFNLATDSLWHFQSAAYRDGVLSPGMQAAIPGRDPATGQLKIDPDAGSLTFVPKQLHNAFRACFLAYRNDFRMESVFASHVQVEISDNLVDPAGDDSLGGLYILIRYAGDLESEMLARTAMKVKNPQTIDLDTCAMVSIRQGDWLSSPIMGKDARAAALGRITGVGLFYISGETSYFSTKPFKVGGFRARGKLRWPLITGTPLDGRVTAGDTLTLRWKFPPGLMDVRFRWFRNDKPVPEAKGAAYLFSPVLEDARVHVFRAEAQLPNGDILPTGEIRVRVVTPAPPVISRQTGDTAVPEGGDAIFKIKASGMQPLGYQWYRNGKAIPGATQTFYTFVPSSINESGHYHCDVTDRLGAVARSRDAVMFVKPGPGSDSRLLRSITFAAKAGVNAADFHRDDKSPAPSRYKWNFVQVGLQAGWQFQPAWSLQADLLYSRKGVGHEFSDYSTVVTLDYLECPLMLRYRIGKKWLPKSPLNLSAGGYGAYLVGAENEVDWGAWKGTETARGFGDWDYGPALGMIWQVGMLSFEWRYSMGLADLRGGAADGPVMIGALSGMIGFNLFTPPETAR